MPGKHHNEDGWRFLTPYKFLRQVSAADTNTGAGIEAIAESINMAVAEASGRVDPVVPITMAFNNILSLSVTMPAAVTQITLQAYAKIVAPVSGGAADPAAGDRWCLYQERLLTRSSIVTIKDLPPVEAKIVIAAITGTGDVTIFYSRSE